MVFLSKRGQGHDYITAEFDTVSWQQAIQICEESFLSMSKSNKRKKAIRLC